MAYLNFFKVYVPETSSNELHVPPPFVSHLNEGGVSLPDTVILRSRRRPSKIWEVKVIREAYGVYFRRGWRIFVRDLSLQFSDLVTFRFDGDRTFHVTVFDKTMIEKNIAAGHDDDDEETDVKKDLDSDDDDEEEEIDVMKYLYSIDNPHFVTKVNVQRLVLPLSISKPLKARGLKMDDIVILLNSKGWEWNKKIKIWTDGRMMIARWRAFCKENGLKNGDKCVVELLHQADEKLVSLVQVHAVRRDSFFHQTPSAAIFEE